MIITYHNIQFFKLQFGDTIVALNPISKKSKHKFSRFGADIALITTGDEDFNGIDNVTSKNRQPFIIDGPGEYEIKQVFIKGAISKTKYKGKERLNTIYSLVMDGMKIGFLGCLESNGLDEKVKSILDNIDILFVPIGGDGVLDATESHKIANKLGAKVVIPMHYGDVGEKNALKKFLKEGGDEKVKPVDKLTIKKKDLEGKEGEMVVIKPGV